MASPPEIARELKWAGFDMLAHANNHAFDYGVTGILETIEHIEQEGLIIAGSGKDLQSARAPRYFKCTACTVGLVAMASDFVSYGRASYKRADLHGRHAGSRRGLRSARSLGRCGNRSTEEVGQRVHIGGFPKPVRVRSLCRPNLV